MFLSNNRYPTITSLTASLKTLAIFSIPLHSIVKIFSTFGWYPEYAPHLYNNAVIMTRYLSFVVDHILLQR
jgi:hypothetical protein